MKQKITTWLTQREQFSIGAFISFILIAILLFSGLLGCTTVIDYPQAIKKEASLQEIELPKLEHCAIVYDYIPWIMSVVPILCKGRTAI